MNKTIISKELILKASKELVIESGMSALNMRNVAMKCGVAVGSVYNYFPSKDELIIAAVESIWSEIIYYDDSNNSQTDFEGAILQLFENFHAGAQKYPLFLIINSMRIVDFDKEKGREVMGRFFSQIEGRLMGSLDNDPKVNQTTFDDEFTKLDYVRFIFSNIFTLITNRASNCEFLISIVRRTIY